MKRTGAVAPLAMAPFLYAVAALIGTAAAAKSSVQAEGASAQTSISQIRDTLRNLLRSIEDNGRDAETLFGKRQLWCDSNTHDFEANNQAVSASLLDMQAQLTETEAEVEEAEGTVQQVKVDIEMVQHTIKQTEDMLKEREGEANHQADADVLASLVDNKQLSLASLQGELEVAVPVLAQLQASVAETKQRISYRTESVTAAKDFISSLRDSCQGSADRADAQAAARVGESNSIHVALQALPAQTQPASDDKDDKGDNAQALSFVQVADRNLEVSTDDLSDLFAADQEAHPASYAAPAAPAVRSSPRVQAKEQMSAAPSLRPRIQTLLTQLKNGDDAFSGLDQNVWCTKQRENSGMALKFAQDSVAQISSELDAHTDAEAELSDELSKLQATSAEVTASAKSVAAQVSKEQALVQSSRKDQQLATKILDQAMTILKELGMSNSTKVVSALDSAKKMLFAQIKASSGFEQQAKAASKALSENALTLTKTQESEQHNLEFAKDDHASQRLRGVENKRLYEADVQEASTYVKKLEESCKANAMGEAKQQRSAQVHALEDADKALQGKLVEAKSTANSLRGFDASHPKPLPENLTPMQRAAMEMGISTD